MHFSSYIFTIGAFMFLLFSLHLIIIKHGNFYLNKLLAIILFCRSVQMLDFIAVNSGNYYFIKVMYSLFDPLYFLYPACIYLYFRGFLNDENKLKPKDWIHFLPLIIGILNIISWYSLDESVRHRVISKIALTQTFYGNENLGYLPDYYVSFILNLLRLTYLLCIWRIVWKSGIIKNKLDTSINKKWILLLLITTTISNISMILSALVHNTQHPENKDETFHSYVSILICMLIISVIGFILYNPKILYGYVLISVNDPKKKDVLTVSPQETIASPKTVLTPIPAVLITNEEKYLEAITKYMNDQKPFLNQDFSMSILSQQTDIPNHHCSYILNHVIKKNFREWVNEYRVEHFIAIYPCLASKQTIAAVAISCGFSNKTSFYNAFVKIKNENPSKYFQNSL